MLRKVRLVYKLFVSIVILVGSFSAWGQTDKSYHLPQGLQKGAYHPTTIIVKLKDAANIGTSSKSRSSSGILGKLKSTASISSIENAFPKSIRNKKNVRSTGKSPLENIYKVDLNEGEDLVASINSLLELEEVVYAEPYFAHQPLAIPNDPNANPTTGAQYYLGVVKAYDAWSIEKGDTNIVIGVLDTGVQPDHPDLRNSIAYNYDDPINGIDDDGDGLIDNFVGWDYADDDNNPFADTDPHGTEMAGISAATTDNSAGMAGIGYRSKFLPIKMFRSGSNFFFGGYESIVLAADLGCDVINLSWGSANSFSQFGQDAINYAVLERNVAIVAAAGNDRQFDNFYPASFDNVLSVAATDIDDNRAFFSSYSYNVDITAPGVDIYATTNGNSYIFRSGTSEASAITAGAMALVRARFPELTGQQVIEKIRVNTDDIYNIGSNGDLEGLLGKGRLNVAKALEVNNSPSLRIDEVAFDNGSGEHAFFGDTLTISADIINFLSPTSNAQITLSSDSPFAEILEGDWGIGVLNTLNETSNSQQPFKVLLSKNLPPNEEIVFKLTMQDGAYNDFQHFIINSSPERLELDNGQLELTVTSDGDLGYDASLSRFGNGFSYQGQTILENFGLILASDPSTVYDNAPTSFFLNRKEADFEALENVKFYRNSVADLDARSVFAEVPTGSPVNIRVEQSALTWDNSNHVILEYRVINRGNSTLNNLHTSLLADWNINNKDFNVADWDSTFNMGYIHSFDNDTLYAGIALITDQLPIYYAINNKNFNGNLADVPSTISDAIKYDLSSGGVANREAGDRNTGNDVSHLMGGTISSLGVNQAEKVTLVLVTGSSLQALRDAVTEARQNYADYQVAPPIQEVFPVCQNDSLLIDPSDGNVFDFYDSPDLSNRITTSTSISTPAVSDEVVYYVVNRDNAFPGDTRRIIARVKSLDIDFDIEPGTLLLDETGNSRVDFTDQSTDAVSWTWDFGNGFIGTVEDPMMNYPSPGTYNITLKATSDIGCVDSLTQTLQVAYRSNLPAIDNQIICKSESVSLSASNVTNLEVYADPELNHLLYTGQPFVSGLINQDTTFYVISTDSTFQSNVQEVKINLSDLKANFINSIDTLDTSSATIMNFDNDSQNDVFYYWVINDEVAGINQSINFDYAGLDSFDLKLIAEDADGCLDTLGTDIIIPQSATPADVVFDLCKEESGIISALDGEIYVFYSDASKSNIIRKGTNLSLANIQTDTTIYFSNINLFGESSLASATYDVNEIQASFNLDNTLINGASQSVFSPINNSSGATKWRWSLDGELISEEENPDIDVGTPDDYVLTLEVQNDIGCLDNTSLDFRIVTITGVEDFDIDLKLFPNPTSTSFQITSPESISYKVIDFNGSTIIEGNSLNPNIDLSNRPNGVYFISIEYQGKVSWRKVIKTD